MDYTTFDGMSANQIKKWIADNKILFMTNSMCMPGTAYLCSLKTYIEYVPIHNFTIIHGSSKDKPHYGCDVFHEMILNTLSKSHAYSHYDYVIYIDDDCFITDFHELMNEFVKFKNVDSPLGGVPDGGAICHRNHSRLMINTFLSFWNLKLIRNEVSFEKYIRYIMDGGMNRSHNFQSFRNTLMDSKKWLYDIMMELSAKAMTESECSRNAIYGDKLPEYAEFIKNDPTNPVEPNQTPYTSDDDTAQTNYEPYYIIQQALVMLTQKPIYYMVGCDYPSKHNGDLSHFNGLTSAVMCVHEESNYTKQICVHTWFTRAYTKFPKNETQLMHTKRVNEIIKQLNLL